MSHWALPLFYYEKGVNLSHNKNSKERNNKPLLERNLLFLHPFLNLVMVVIMKISNNGCPNYSQTYPLQENNKKVYISITVTKFILALQNPFRNVLSRLNHKRKFKSSFSFTLLKSSYKSFFCNIRRIKKIIFKKKQINVWMELLVSSQFSGVIFLLYLNS